MLIQLIFLGIGSRNIIMHNILCLPSYVEEEFSRLPYPLIYLTALKTILPNTICLHIDLVEFSRAPRRFINGTGNIPCGIAYPIQTRKMCRNTISPLYNLEKFPYPSLQPIRLHHLHQQNMNFQHFVWLIAHSKKNNEPKHVMSIF